MTAVMAVTWTVGAFASTVLFDVDFDSPPHHHDTVVATGSGPNTPSAIIGRPRVVYNPEMESHVLDFNTVENDYPNYYDGVIFEVSPSFQQYGVSFNMMTNNFVGQSVNGLQVFLGNIFLNVNPSGTMTIGESLPNQEGSGGYNFLNFKDNEIIFVSLGFDVQNQEVSVGTSVSGGPLKINSYSDPVNPLNGLSEISMMFGGPGGDVCQHDNLYVDNIYITGHNANPVPIPGTLWLLGSGLAGIFLKRRAKCQ